MYGEYAYGGYVTFPLRPPSPGQHTPPARESGGRTLPLGGAAAFSARGEPSSEGAPAGRAPCVRVLLVAERPAVMYGLARALRRAGSGAELARDLGTVARRELRSYRAVALPECARGRLRCVERALEDAGASARVAVVDTGLPPVALAQVQSALQNGGLGLRALSGEVRVLLTRAAPVGVEVHRRDRLRRLRTHRLCTPTVLPPGESRLVLPPGARRRGYAVARAGAAVRVAELPD
ncbi:hypothetical protein [Streptomyces xiaopingdaonensis]|uniref:hypothetical protein n=1 Tax=Streptomyces xiaopingdaonensis TaxID=1565415 RepID=UPI0002F9C16E|nr:hypothetical protein [Streptomyces xiaopingdaonensis]